VGLYRRTPFSPILLLLTGYLKAKKISDLILLQRRSAARIAFVFCFFSMGGVLPFAIFLKYVLT